GLFALKKEISSKIDQKVPEKCRRPVRFILQTEISNIYKKNGKVRKNHNLIYFPGLESVKKFNIKLDKIGNIRSDGRPILGLDARDLLEIMLEIDDRGFFVPAHIWTPWFSLFGSKSGFDSMEECFEDLTPHIFAVETGLSSDPPMNWRIKQLDDIRLISNSDAHSPGYLGRNASIFNCKMGFGNIRKALEKNDLERYLGTYDMYPHQGKYHYDGHRKCNVRLNPAVTQKIGGICPVCGKKVVYGVLNRVQELATRPEGYLPEKRHGYQSIIPLTDILSEIFEVGPKTKKVMSYYDKAVDALGPELEILVDRTYEEIDTAKVPLLSEAVAKMRKGKIKIDPGFDGEFGTVNIFSRKEKEALKGEKNLLFTLPAKKKKSNASKNKILSLEPNSPKPLENKVVKIPLPENHDLLSSLNCEQKKAVESNASALLIEAGPGTGKTRTLTAKIAHLVSKEKKDPKNILALTFTNKAAAQIGERIIKYIPKASGTVLSATFHSFCLMLLKEYKNFDRCIADDDLRREFIGQAAGFKQVSPKKIDGMISICKQNLLGPQDDLAHLLGEQNPDEFKEIYQAYQTLCEYQKVVDFEDLIFMVLEALNTDGQMLQKVQKRFQHIFIDEYQDLNKGQYELAKLISLQSYIAVIGDPDQSIYGFRGSDNKYFKRFAQDYPDCEKIILTQNYRSTQTILDASFQMISKPDSEKDKQKIYSDIQGAKKLIIKQTGSDKAEAVAIGKMIENLVGGISFFSMDANKIDLEQQKEFSFADFAILFRTKKQGDIFSKVFEKEGIPFQMADRRGIFLEQGIRQLLSLVKILCLKANLFDFLIVFDHFKVGMGKRSKAIFLLFAKERNGADPKFLKKIAENGVPEIRNNINVKLMTVCQNLLEIQNKIRERDIKFILEILAETSGIGKLIQSSEKSVYAYDKLISLAETQGANISGFLDAISLNQDPDNIDQRVEKVSMMTIHAAKGLEFPVVFVAGCEEGLIPYARNGEACEDLEEERRLFYVAMTRAKDILCLTYAGKRSIYGKNIMRKRSFFIDDIEEKLKTLEKPEYKRETKRHNEQQLELF
ncbi:MAG: UvrD-helicase domain-containing protein, partial [Desulfobacteraceae bacterium]|nr:UvrD-helicase domain-containing protein [Desulfobacteraceae bacterium]